MSKHEKITAAQLNKVASPHCSNCGSSDLQAQAEARWNVHMQNWEIFTIDETSCVCCRCGRDCTIKWRLT